MNKLTIYLLLFITLYTGCKNSNTPREESSPAYNENYIPAVPLHTAKYDYSTPPELIDIESAITGSAPVRLSQIASHIEYYAVGDDKYPVTDMVAVDGGFIALNQPKLYLYRKGIKRKRVGLKTEYNNWRDYVWGGNHLYYDKETTQLYTFFKKVTSETTHAKEYIGVLPPLDSVLARVYYLYPDSLPAYYYPKRKEENRILTFDKDLYVMPFKTDRNFYEGINTFNLNGDTICRFFIGTDKYTGNFPPHYPQVPWIEKAYRINSNVRFYLPFCDTIYSLPDKETIQPAFHVHMGKHRLSLEDIRQEKNQKNKAWVTSLTENNQAVFLDVYKNGNSSKGGWITDDSQRDDPSADYRIVYLKSIKKTISLPIDSKEIINDLDDGLPFWPEGQTDEYLYLIRPVSELKKNIKPNGSAKQKELKRFLEETPDGQNVMIVVY